MCVKGKVISVVGLNGAGKSLLLSLLGGLFRPSKGLLYRKNSAIRSAYFSRLSDCPSFYSIEHHHKLMKRYHLLKNNDTKLFKVLKQIMDVDFRKKKGGDRIKRSLCYALASCPHVLLLDEPFSS